MPIGWANIEHTNPTDYTITNALEILETEKDPWKDIFLNKQDLVQILGKISELPQ
jgi:DNA primase